MSIAKNINYIRQAMRFPCAVGGPVVVIKTGLEAALPVLFSLSQFSCLDIIKSRAGISWKCGRQLKGIIDKAHGPSIVNTGHFLYKLGPALAEKGLWWWFVAELGTGFIADWTSLMYQESGCEGPASNHFTVDAQALFKDPGGVYGAQIDASPDGPCAFSRSNAITVPGGCTASIMYEMLWEPFRADLDPTCDVESWLEDNNGTQYMRQRVQWKPKDVDGNAFGALVHLESRFADAKHYHINYIVHAGLSGARKGHVHVTTTGRNVTPFPAGCKPKNAQISQLFGGDAERTDAAAKDWGRQTEEIAKQNGVENISIVDKAKLEELKAVGYSSRSAARIVFGKK